MSNDASGQEAQTKPKGKPAERLNRMIREQIPGGDLLLQAQWRLYNAVRDRSAGRTREERDAISSLLRGLGNLLDETRDRLSGRRPAPQRDLPRPSDPIARSPKSTVAYEWSTEQDAMLGKQPDKDLAALWGRDTETVRRRRLKLRISAYRAMRVWTAKEIALIDNPDLSTEDLAKRLDVNPTYANVVRHRRRKQLEAQA